MLKRALLAAVVATALFQSPAHAGLKDIYPLGVAWHSDGTITFWGSLGSVRNSSNPVEELGCNTVHQPGGFTLGYCYAVHHSGQGTFEVSCTTYDPNMVAAFRSVGTDTFVHLTVDREGRCSNILIQNQSLLPPKAP